MTCVGGEFISTVATIAVHLVLALALVSRSAAVSCGASGASGGSSMSFSSKPLFSSFSIGISMYRESFAVCRARRWW